MKSGEMIQAIVASLMTGPHNEIFSDFHDMEYDSIMDMILLTRHGSMTVDPEMATADDTSMADMAIYAYLTERAIYIRQNLAYEAAEYNPIENYSQIEQESTVTDIGARSGLDTHTDRAHTFSTEHQHGAQDNNRTYTDQAHTSSIEHQHGVQDYQNTHTEQAHTFSIEHDYQQHQQTTHTPQMISESYTEADVKTEVEQLPTTVLSQKTPFESSDFFNNERTTTTPGKTTNTEKPYNRKTKTPDHTVTVTDLAHKDTDTEKHLSDEVTTDRMLTTQYTDIDTEKHLADEVKTDRFQSQQFTDIVTEKHLADEVQTDSRTQQAARDSVLRNLSRSGNIGVQTAAQMMLLDSDFWKGNLWIRQMCLDIVNLICERTVCSL